METKLVLAICLLTIFISGSNAHASMYGSSVNPHYGSYNPYDEEKYRSSNYDYNYDNYAHDVTDGGNTHSDQDLEGLLYQVMASTLQNTITGQSPIHGNRMSSAARILTYGSQPKMGYQQQQPKQPSYGHQQMKGYGHQQQQSYGHKVQTQSYHQQQPSGYGYSMTKHQSRYHDDDDDDGYGHKMTYKPRKRKKKQKIKKVYVPIVIKKKKKKKRKTIAVFKGFYIQGGTQIFGKFKKMKDCKKACEITPNCFAADYNPWLKKCYIHTNVSACEEMRTHPKLIHFKKVPCDLLETPRGLITLGVRIFGGLEQKGVKNLQDCVKKCATAGQGISPDSMTVNIMKQICFGIDYDFATHKCYFHTNELLCPAVDPIPTPVQVVEAPSVINILLCPLTSVT